MSTEIRSAYSPECQWVRLGALRNYDPPRLAITAEGDGGRAIDNVTMPDFLAAVATECDAIVIPRADLPEVEVNPTYIAEREASRTGERPYASIALPTQHSAEDFRRLGIGFIALAEHLAAHPPVDEAQVDAIVDALLSARPGPLEAIEWTAMARRLYAQGVRTEVTP